MAAARAAWMTRACALRTAAAFNPGICLSGAGGVGRWTAAPLAGARAAADLGGTGGAALSASSESESSAMTDAMRRAHRQEPEDAA
jgi:hypothetical protein